MAAKTVSWCALFSLIVVWVFGDTAAGQQQFNGLPPNVQFVPDEIIVKFKPGVGKVEAPQKDTANSSEAVDAVVASESPYLRAVREFADNVLKYGRDTYGPKHTPLFVDGLNVNTHEPVKWISPKGERWILSNFASQQTLLRTLDGLSKVTGDPKYRDAAIQAIKYACENLRSPNGLFYWGHYVAYDAQADQVKYASARWHILKVHYPYYELMWQVDPGAAKKFIDAYWSAHVIDWSNLDFNRYAVYSDYIEEPWKHEYKDSPTFFKSKRSDGGGFLNTGTSLAHAGTTLYRLSGEEQPLVWSKRLIQRFVDTRHAKTGMARYFYNKLQASPLGDNLSDHFTDPHSFIFPTYPFPELRKIYYPEYVEPHQWMSLLLMGDMIGEQGREFSRWAAEELTAWGKVSYRKEDNSFIPIITDGTNIEGYVLKEDCGRGEKGSIATPLFADLSFFWAYATAYRITGDEFMWQMARDIGTGNRFGDIGENPGRNPEFNIDTTCSDVYGLLGFLELYNKTKKQEFLLMARRIADNIVETKFHKGFFVPSKRHIYTRFDCFEPLALLHLTAAVECQSGFVPRVWPSSPLFVPPYRYRQEGVDRRIIYTLTESPEVPLSLQEAAVIGNVDMVESLLEGGIHVDSMDNSYIVTALHCAAKAGHKHVAELLIAKGARVNHGGDNSTPLHCAIQYGHRDVVELLLAHGADVNIKDDWGRGKTPLDIALTRGNEVIVKLLLDKAAMTSSIHYTFLAAVQMGNQEQVKALLDQGIDADEKDKVGKTPLFYAVEHNHKDIVELLIAKGADVNAKADGGYTPLYYALWYENKDLTTLLISKGAEVNVEPEKDYPPIYYAVWNEDLDTVRLLVAKGAKFDVRILEDRTAFHYAVGQGSRDIAAFFVSKGIDASTFHVAAGMGDLARVKNHIEQGADVNRQDELGWTPLYWAASLGQTEVAKLLIHKGADVRTPATDGGMALHQAAQAGDNELVELLLSKGADVQAKTKRGDTPLHSAAGSGHREVTECLIAKGAEIDAKDMGGRTPLHRAALRGHRDVVEILIAHGADVTVKDRAGRTPLQWAEQRGHNEIVKLLLESTDAVSTPFFSFVRDGSKKSLEQLIDMGVDINIVDEYGLTPLHCATQRGHINIVTFLIAQGARHDAKDNAGRTPLHYASGAGSLEGAAPANMPDVIRILLDNNASLHATDTIGWTPLHYAVHVRSKDIVQFLIDNGADVDSVDHRGRTPYRWIQERLDRFRTEGSLFVDVGSEKIKLNRIREFQEIAQLLKRSVYYVATSGKDDNPGTLERPFRSMTAVVEIAEPGDLVLIRGGTYVYMHTFHIDTSGNQAKPIYLRAYPGEVPVFDFSGARGHGLYITGAYWHLKDLVITGGECGNVFLYGDGACHNILEQVSASSSHRNGIDARGGAAYNIILNCDSYNNFEREKNGENGDGFGFFYIYGKGNVLIGNRAWNNCDDGIDLFGSHSIRAERCYIWSNGVNIWNHPFFIGNGNGFKLGKGEGRHIAINCVAWNNPHRGFDLNANTEGVILRNCTGWGNKINYFFETHRGEAGNSLRNNLSFRGSDSIGAGVDSRSNNWDADLGLNLTDDDFLSLDDSMMSAPRNPDGSIPQNDFLKLAPQSAAIDKGIDVGLPFVGAGPDLGAFEHDSNASSQGYVKMLHQYVRDHDMPKIKGLLAQGEGINDKDWLGYTPLQWAVYFGYSDLAELLIAKGADVNIQSDTGRFALEIAKAMAYADIEALLRKHGAKADGTTVSEETSDEVKQDEAHAKTE